MRLKFLLFFACLLYGCSFEDPGVAFFEGDDVGVDIEQDSTFIDSKIVEEDEGQPYPLHDMGGGEDAESDSSGEDSPEDMPTEDMPTEVDQGIPDASVDQDQGADADVDLPLTCFPDEIEVEGECLTDEDGDGIPDDFDNCVDVPNTFQQDSDGDGVGDVCDNCLQIFNPDQENSGTSNYGDACSPVPQGPVCHTQTLTHQGNGLNIYLLLDRSDRMGLGGGTGMNMEPLRTAKQGLDQVVDAFSSSTKFGMSSYAGHQCPGLENRIAMGPHSKTTLKATWSSIYGVNGGSTLTTSLGAIKAQGLYHASSDPNDVNRKKVVVIFTANTNNTCSDTGPEVEAALMYSEGVHVFVVSYDYSNATVMNNVADAGGTDGPGPNRFYNHNSLPAMIQDIQALDTPQVSCTQSLDITPPDVNRIWVKVGGQVIPRSDFQYDVLNNEVVLSNAACSDLKADTSNTFEVVLGCN